MIIISHRGHWLATEEKNTALAFRRSFLSGFGTETDVRDHLGKLVISHDVVPPDANPLLLDDFLEIYGNFDQPLAINIKSDGLAEILNSTMNRHGITNWFVFDMSIPDMRHHLAIGNPTFTRMSDVELHPVWSDRCTGIWLDSFDECWFTLKDIETRINAGKKVCLVSPELHGRPHLPMWDMIKPLAGHESFILCTDLPVFARDYFGN